VVVDVLFLALYAVVDVLSPASYAVDALSLASYEVAVDVFSQTSCTLVADVLSPASSEEAVASFVVHVAVDSPSCVDAEEHVAIQKHGIVFFLVTAYHAFLCPPKNT
jgi:hypothetical protein